MKTRGGWRETPQSHEVAVRDVTQMTDEHLIEGIRYLDSELAPMLELKANGDQRGPDRNASEARGRG